MNKEKVRCVNAKEDLVGYFPSEFANDKSWQKSTGYVPQPLPDGEEEEALSDGEKEAEDLNLEKESTEEFNLDEVEHSESSEKEDLEDPEDITSTEIPLDILSDDEVLEEVEAEVIASDDLDDKKEEKVKKVSSSIKQDSKAKNSRR